MNFFFGKYKFHQNDIISKGYSCPQKAAASEVAINLPIQYVPIMRIGSENEYIELKELERTPEGTPCAGDVNLKVTLNLQDFRGSYSGVWLEAPEMESFLIALEVLETERKGSAKIISMSPEEFVLEIRSSDALGHMEIEAQLHRYQYSGPKYWPISLRGGFEVQPETIRQLISCFKAFTK